MGGVSFVKLSPIISCHWRRAYSHVSLPIWKRLVCRNPTGHHYLPPGGRIGRGWSVLCRVSCVRLYPLFCCRRRCCTHSCQESPLGKGWVGCNPSENYHMLPGERSGNGLSCLRTTFSSFLSLSLSHSQSSGSFFFSLCFLIKLTYLLNMPFAHFLCCCNFFSIMSIISSNRTHNLIGYSKHCKY